MGRTYENRKAAMAKTQGAKTKVYSKYGKEIYVCAKNGGGDPDANLALRRLIERAKKDQVPSHVIDKAIEKAQGAGGENYAPVRYEGFGPGGCMVIVDCLTDNNNRTFGDVRTVFNKNDAKLGAPGAVAHMFDHRGIFVLVTDNEEAVLEALTSADVDLADIESEENDRVTVLVPHTEFYKAKTALAEALPSVEIDVEEIAFVPQTFALLQGEDVASFEKFLSMLNDCDDVQEVYHNAEFEE